MQTVFCCRRDDFQFKKARENEQEGESYWRKKLKLESPKASWEAGTTQTQCSWRTYVKMYFIDTSLTRSFNANISLCTKEEKGSNFNWTEKCASLKKNTFFLYLNIIFYESEFNTGLLYKSCRRMFSGICQSHFLRLIKIMTRKVNVWMERL